MSLAAVAVRNQRRRANQQQQQLLQQQEEPLQPKVSLDASDPNLKLRKIPHDQKGRHFQPRPRKEIAEENHANYRKKNKVTQNEPDVTDDFVAQIEIDQLDGEEGIYRASSSANVVLYVGLGMISIGLVITFVGLGDKGFRTLELKLVGPSLVGCGIFFALLRILFCTMPTCCRACFKCCRKSEDKEDLLDQDVDGSPSKQPVVISNRSRSDSSSKRSRPSTGKASTSGRDSSTRTPRKPPRSKSDDEDEDQSELESSGEFKKKKLRNSQNDNAEITTLTAGDTSALTSSRGGDRGRLRGRGPAKPLSYDNYSTDTSSQFSVDIVEVESVPKLNNYEGSDTEIGHEEQNNLEAREIVLNASRLQVESETG